jgi:hypothetical protein
MKTFIVWAAATFVIFAFSWMPVQFANVSPKRRRAL